MGRKAYSRTDVNSLSILLVDLCRQERAARLRGDVAAHHRLSDRMLAVAETLKQRGEEGRKALLSLIDHEEQNVQLWAAAHSLDFAPEVAVPALERLIAWGEQGAKGDLQPDVVSIGITATNSLHVWRAERGLLTPEEKLWLKP